MTDHLVRADGAADDEDERAPGDGQRTASDGARDAGGTPDGATTAPNRWQRWRAHRGSRVSKWDRPPDPKDWRYFVGALGKVLIATGILMFGFVAYQLWGTGIETARAQNQLESGFEERFAAAVAARDATDAPPTGDAAGDPVGDRGDDGTTEGDTTDDGGILTGEPIGTDDAIPTATRTPSEVVPGGEDLSAEAVEQNVPVVPGEAFARLEIPKIGVSHYVVPGVTLTDLKKGPGHYPDTPLPGQLGNASIAGHRTTYGAPFFDVGELVPGDEMTVTMITGDRFVYRVTGLEVVTAADSWVITTRDPNVAELTLTTCHPKYTARDRLVVHSVLVPEKSSQVGVAEFYQLDPPEAAEEISGDDPTVTTPTDDATATDGDSTADGDATGATVPTVETATGGDTDAADEPVIGEQPVADTDSAATDDDPAATTTGDAADDATGASTENPATDADADATPPGIDDDAEIDAFSEGWFHDRSAFPQIALWGTVLTIISLLAYQVSKKTRHDSIGFLVGIAPFLICLYFFFQNVNRLLPPGL